MLSAAPPKIVLTGGPGAGKSVITAAIARRDPRFILVPEAATQVYTTLGTRWDRLDLLRRRDAQQMIYRKQVEQERDIAAAHPSKVLLLDRGTIDGAAYWPEGPAEYWRAVGTTIEAELARYTAIIWLETAATLGIYDGSASNTVRFEDADAAITSGQLLLNLYRPHDNVKHVGAFASLDDKIAAVMETIDAILCAPK